MGRPWSPDRFCMSPRERPSHCPTWPGPSTRAKDFDFEFTAPTCPERPPLTRTCRSSNTPSIFPYGAHLAYVEVDELTGQVEVKKYLSVTDCGRVINPQVYEQQMQGAVAQGLGLAIFEDFRVEQGRVRTPDLATYIIPTALDLPDMETLAVEIPEPSGPFGLKGAGEIGIDGPLPAVANAVAEPIGKRIFQAPLTTERILSAMGNITKCNKIDCLFAADKTDNCRQNLISLLSSPAIPGFPFVKVHKGKKVTSVVRLCAVRG